MNKKKQSQSFLSKLRPTIKHRFEQQEFLSHLLEFGLSSLELLMRLHKLCGWLFERSLCLIPGVNFLLQGIGHCVMAAAKITRKTPGKSLSIGQKCAAGVKAVSGVLMVAAAVVGFVLPPLGAAMIASVAGVALGQTLFKAAHTRFKSSEAHKKMASARSDSPDSVSPPQGSLKEKGVTYHLKKMKQRRYEVSAAVVTLGLSIGLVVAGPVVAIGLVVAVVAVNVSFIAQRFSLASRIKQKFTRARPVKVSGVQSEDATDIPAPVDESEKTERFLAEQQHVLQSVVIEQSAQPSDQQGHASPDKEHQLACRIHGSEKEAMAREQLANHASIAQTAFIFNDIEQHDKNKNEAEPCTKVEKTTSVEDKDDEDEGEGPFEN